VTASKAAPAAPRPRASAPRRTGHGSLAAALAAFQAALPRVGKDNEAHVTTEKGPGYSYRYADLSEISPVVLPLLAAQGLAWSTRPTLTPEGRFVLVYRLSHTSGQEDTGEYPLPNPASSPQVLGSAITYARRYALCAVTGVAPGSDDDDAAAAQEQQRQQREQQRERQQQRPQRQQPPAGQAPDAEKPQDNGAASAKAARDLLRADITKNGWSSSRIGELFAETHGGQDLRQADMRTVEAFRKGLYARPDHELRDPEQQSQEEPPAAEEPPAEEPS
jgi:hypothetical protein